ncbi:MAG: VWA domain-containing protein [Gemmatimonadota bacterium]
MTFLAPMLLLLGFAVVVPLVLHLLRRQHAPQVVFPAVRYLHRAEREHARRIRLRQLLLLGLRIALILALAAAAARPFVHLAGAGHPPTLVVLVLDNSASTGLVQDDRRVLDDLKDRALESLVAATPEDRFYLILAGSGEPAFRGTAAAVAERVRAAPVSAGQADLGAALRHAAALLGSARGRKAEIQLLTDMQATSFHGPVTGISVPVLLWSAAGTTPRNRAIVNAMPAGGIAPRAGQRTALVVDVAGPADDTVALRLVVGNTVRAAASAVPGATSVLELPAAQPGWVAGRVEMDADAFHADDVRYFVVPVVAPPAVALSAAVPFVEDAVAVLADAGRIRRATLDRATVVIAPDGVAVDAVHRGATVLVLPPDSLARLPALNQRLANAGVPWRYVARPLSGEARLRTNQGTDLEAVLADVRLRTAYSLEPAGRRNGRDTVLLALRDGTPWLLRGTLSGAGRYLLLATPLSGTASNIPVSAAMLPLLDRVLGDWSGGPPPYSSLTPGQSLALPDGAQVVAGPGGRVDTVAGGVSFSAPGVAGLYTVRGENDSTLAVFAVNPPAAESRLARADPTTVLGSLDLHRVHQERDWRRAVFAQRRGVALTSLLLLLAVALLVAESAVGASGRAARRTAPDRPRPAGGR